MIKRVLMLGTFLIFVSATVLWGQSNVGRITGTVTDPSGAVVPGCAVTAENTQTGVKQSATTQEGGNYVFPSLVAGTYNVTVEMKGFKTSRESGVVVDAAAVRTVNIALVVGGSNEEISVIASAEQVQTSTGEVSKVIDNRMVTDLGLNGRNFMQLLRLVPGTVSTTLDAFSVGLSTTGQSINGVRTYIDARIDGSSNVDTGGNISQRSTPNPDSIAEVRVLTSGYAAEYGGRAGALMNVITKSGTKDFHGSLFEFVRNSAFDARSFFQTARPVLHFNDFGGTFGGPVVIPGKFNQDRSKLFFFGAFEQKYQHQETSSLSTVPTLEERNGNFQNSKLAAPIDPLTGQAFPNRTVPSTRWSTNGAALLKPYPLPNYSGAGGSNFSFSNISWTEPREYMVKGDYIINDKTRLSARYSKDYWKLKSQNALGFPPWNIKRPGWLASVNLTQSFSPTFLNYVSIGAGHNHYESTPEVSYMTRSLLGLTYAQLYPGDDFGGIGPTVAITGFTGYGNSGGNDHKYVTDIEFHDDLTKIFGTHMFKFGVMIDRARCDEGPYQSPNTEGTATFNTSASKSTKNALADVLLGNFYSYNEYAVSDFYRSRYTQAEFYAQDTWRIGKKLTLNYGVRYVIIPPNYSTSGNVSTFIPSLYSASKAPTVSRVNGAITPGTGSATNGIVLLGSSWSDFPQSNMVSQSKDASLNNLFIGLPVGGASTYYKNFSPRIGIAYDPFGDGKTSIRTGFGIFYDTPVQASLNIPSRNPPFDALAVVFNGSIDNISAGNSAFPPTIGSFAQNMRPPTVYSYNLNVQRQLPGHVILEVGYVGTIGLHLGRVLDINQLPVGTLTLAANKGVNANALRPYQGYASIAQQDFGDRSNYNSMQINAGRRMATGLSFGSSFTWAKTMDTSIAGGFNGNTSTSQVQDVYNIKADRALAPISRKFVLSGNVQYDLSFFNKVGNALLRTVLGGWTLSGMVQAQSGAPNTVSVPSDVAGIGVASSRASLVSGASLSVDQRTTTKWFNTAAFLTASQMTAGQFGNTGRNILIGPGYSTVDMSVYKSFKFSERTSMQFRTESFNLLNHASFTSLGTSVGTATFGNVTGAGPGRVLQFGLKLMF